MYNRLKEFRKIFFKNQQELAEVLNISRFMVSEYESGKSSLSVEKLNILSSLYRLNLNWLISGQGTMLLDDVEKINIQELKKENERLQIENQLLKELIKK